VSIRFYRIDEPYGCFSNFSRHPIVLDGLPWPTSEHYFQAQKFAGTPHAEEVRTAETPMRAAELGRERTRPLRADWEEIKDDAMRAAGRAKFSQHADLREILLGTGDEHLIEHTANDRYWADGGDGSGRNMLGRILMEVRAELRDW
jgi:ribA/ribD-fused uncharacterized protein